jgi:hypothetical protein
MPLTAAEQRARRLAEQRRRVSSAQRVDQRSRVSSAQHAARRAYSSVCPDGMDSDIDGADDSDSDGADDAFAAEPNEGARSPVASPGGGAGGIDSDRATTAPTTPTAMARTTRSPPKPAMMRAPPLLPQVAAGRTQTTATTALVRPLLTPPRTSCPTATLLRALLFTGLLCCGIASVHCSCCTTVACVHLPQPQPHLMHVRARFPCRISSCWREQPHAALPSHSCPLLPECGKRACAQAWT